MVSRVRKIEPPATNANTIQEIVVRYSYWANHLARKYQATGMAIKQEMSTSATNSLERSDQRWKTDAPSTFRTLISFMRISATKEARPSRPRQEMKMARMAKQEARFPIRSSSKNFL